MVNVLDVKESNISMLLMFHTRENVGGESSS